MASSLAEHGSLVPQAQSVTRGEAQISLEVNIKKNKFFIEKKRNHCKNCECCQGHTLMSGDYDCHDLGF